jgi:hypothetical protein
MSTTQSGGRGGNEKPPQKPKVQAKGDNANKEQTPLTKEKVPDEAEYGEDDSQPYEEPYNEDEEWYDKAKAIEEDFYGKDEGHKEGE